MTARQIQRHLQDLADPAAALDAGRFFKTGPGQYGEGDQFLGVRVPVLRKLSRTHKALPLDQIEILLHSPLHELRALALMILVLQVQRADTAERRVRYEFYLANARFVNNWDLVDISAEHLLGGYLFDRSRRPLDKLAKSPILWERRMAILATFYFIRRDDFDDTLRIAQRLLPDREDLIHKAVGWMLRELGKRDVDLLEAFLQTHHAQMPRTALRYAIERLPLARRQAYLRGEI